MSLVKGFWILEQCDFWFRCIWIPALQWSRATKRDERQLVDSLVFVSVDLSGWCGITCGASLAGLIASSYSVVKQITACRHWDWHLAWVCGDNNTYEVDEFVTIFIKSLGNETIAAEAFAYHGISDTMSVHDTKRYPNWNAWHQED